MSIKALNLTATEKYELSFDDAKGTPEASTFTLRSLDSRVIGRIRDSSSTLTLDQSENELQTNVNMNEMNFQWVQFGLAGWTKFYDENSNAIDIAFVSETIGGYVYQVVSPAVMRLLPDIAITELADRIQKRNTMTKAEEKNSET
jgi:hypothetical protein